MSTTINDLLDDAKKLSALISQRGHIVSKIETNGHSITISLDFSSQLLQENKDVQLDAMLGTDDELIQRINELIDKKLTTKFIVDKERLTLG